MSRCKACNRALVGRETSYKDDQGEFLDLCRGCKDISWNALERDTFKWDVLKTDGTFNPTNGMVEDQ